VQPPSDADEIAWEARKPDRRRTDLKTGNAVFRFRFIFPR